MTTRGGPTGEAAVLQVLDARLLPAALSCWAATAATLTMGWTIGLVLAAVLAAFAAVVVALTIRSTDRSVRWRSAALVALGAVILGAGCAVAAAWRERAAATHPLRNAVGLSVRVVITPTTDPKPLRSKTFGANRTWVVRAELHEFRRAGTTVHSGGAVVVLATGSEWGELTPGRRVEVQARADRPNRADLTIAVLHARGSPVLAESLPWWHRIANAVRGDFAASAREALPVDAAGLLPALVVGDVSHLPDGVREDFERAGLQHLCVVSGANFTILLSFVLFASRLFALGPWATVGAAATVLLMFVVVARPEPSVLRAAAMGSITLLAVLTGRRKQALPALCAAVVALLTLWPELAIDVGFALSVVATGGLILLAPSWADWLRAHGWWRAPAEIVAVSAGAFVVTTPIMIALTGRLSLVAVLANIIVAPVVAPIMLIGTSGAVLSCLWSPLAEFVLRCAAAPMWWLLSVAAHTAALPGASVAVPGGRRGGLVAGVVVVVVIAVLRSRVGRHLVVTVVSGVALVLVPAHLWYPAWPPDGWVVAACDVGQGDGLALAVGPGAAVVIDVGPDPRAIRRCLDGLRISRIPLLILTHPHADHIGGITGALRNRKVDAIAVGNRELDALISAGQVEPDRATCDARFECSVVALPAAISHRSVAAGNTSGLMQVAAVAGDAGVPMWELSAGHQLNFGAVGLEVLAPTSSSPRPVPGAEADNANDRSVVIVARTRVGRVLFTGDIEEPTQRALLHSGAHIQADILKLPHHGSRTSASDFLEAIQPRLVLVSVGAQNTFGHPNAAVLAGLTSRGAMVARTDLRGDIVVLGNREQPRMASSR